MIHALFFNGLSDGTTRKREQLAIDYLAKRDITVEHVGIDWYSEESFEQLLTRVTKITKDKLKKHGKIVLVGSSASGSLVINILGKLQNRNISAVTLCSRLHLAKLPWWDWRDLKRMAYIGKAKASQKFYDSVVYCTKTILKLSKEDKERITIVQQRADDVVPRSTMIIEGVRIYKVPAIGHGWGIALGARRLPWILQQTVKAE